MADQTPEESGPSSTSNIMENNVEIPKAIEADPELEESSDSEEEESESEECESAIDLTELREENKFLREKVRRVDLEIAENRRKLADLLRKCQEKQEEVNRNRAILAKLQQDSQGLELGFLTILQASLVPSVPKTDESKSEESRTQQCTKNGVYRPRNALVRKNVNFYKPRSQNRAAEKDTKRRISDRVLCQRIFPGQNDFGISIMDSSSPKMEAKSL